MTNDKQHNQISHMGKMVDEKSQKDNAPIVNTKGEQPIMPRPEDLADGKNPSWNGY